MAMGAFQRAAQLEQIPLGQSTTRAVVTQNGWKDVTRGIAQIILVFMLMDTISGRLRRKPIKVDRLPVCDAY